MRPNDEVPETSDALNILVTELDNIRAGWHWAIMHRDFDGIGKYVTALAWLADAHGLYGEVVAEFEQVCALARSLLVQCGGDSITDVM
jgi:hypothetical protein